VALKLYNTLTRKKEAFEPLDASNLRIYVCGPTVYDFAHIGNARPVIVFDVLYRLLRHLYGPEHVTYVRNITDVDDKINARAAETYPDLPLNEAIGLVTKKTTEQFHKDMAALGALPPTVEPRATEHIKPMKAMIDRLIKRGCAYVAEDHVLFHVASMPDYGKLSGRSLDEMIAGARVEVAPFKRDPMDFVLWKPSKPGEPSWPSPAGIETPGRPGWHIECSAMAEAHLGEIFDIHGGGIDLVFPHHENEIAQSRCAHGTPVMARYWLHNGFLQVEGEKMAKSLGNFVTVHELLTQWHGRPWSGGVIRLAMLDAHYRSPLDWTQRKLEQIDYEFLRFTSALFSTAASFFDSNLWKFLEFINSRPVQVPSRVIDCLYDDLNTPAALAYLRSQYDRMAHDLDVALEVLHAFEFLGLASRETVFLNHTPGVYRIFDYARMTEAFRLGRDLAISDLNKLDSEGRRVLAEISERNWQVRHVGMGMLLIEPADDTSATEERVRALIARRNEARKERDFAEADRIRTELSAMGVRLTDVKDPNTGELVTTWELGR
jgi:cysteinyl-tRNA synthetase